MIISSQRQDDISTATEFAQPLVTILDLELLHVGGGTETGVLF